MVRERQAKGSKEDSGGTHGWDDTSPDGKGYKEGNMKDMRGVYFGKG